MGVCLTHNIPLRSASAGHWLKLSPFTSLMCIMGPNRANPPTTDGRLFHHHTHFPRHIRGIGNNWFNEPVPPQLPEQDRVS